MHGILSIDYILLLLLDDQDKNKLIWEGYKRNHKGAIPPQVCSYVPLYVHSFIPYCMLFYQALIGYINIFYLTFW